MGKQVGDGQCTGLVIAALQYAGAAQRFPDAPKKGDYVWGRRVYYRSANKGGFVEAGGERRGDPILPGDIIQYRDAVFHRTTENGSYSSFAPHHTSIVVAVADRGKTLTIQEQNSNGQPIVVESTLRLGDMKKGWIRIYRPLEK